ncbi:helix-turn-helix transcriptional regulator [Flavivirga aquimarina]|uniref:Helix-turn-helix transcriptional regulator n=1 Tax=Flavivirga aquimarina TaxID=2027862 RepID=A0ABT8W887_9FLAO|nr:helix-turn-helix transcriptional regulator [Flavivirga aquimarina]MDO5969308.1 helix-turn-helix transcriptional regulator [Flavivirga aquimarina]
MKDSKELELISKIGVGIKTLRKELSITQLDLAIASGLDVRQIQRMEAGRTSPTLKTLIKLANSFEMNIFEFFEHIKK